MVFSVSNHTPTPLDTSFFPRSLTCTNVSDMLSHWLSNFALHPAIPGTDVIISDDTATTPTVPLSDITERFYAALDPETAGGDRRHNLEMVTLLEKLSGTVNKTHNLSLDSAWFSQALTMQNLPAPVYDKITYYAHTDVIPAASGYTDCYTGNLPKIGAASTNIAVTGNNYAEQFFIALKATYNINTLGVGFANGDEFARFIDFFTQYTTVLDAQGVLADTTKAQITQFISLGLESLTYALRLSSETTDTGHDYCFKRVLISALDEYIKTNAKKNAAHNKPQSVMWMPFGFYQFLNPETLVFANISAHSTASVKDINTQWETIRDALDSPIKVMSHNALTKLTTAVSQRNKAEQQAHIAAVKKDIERRQAVTSDISPKPPQIKHLARLLEKIVFSMEQVSRSHNVQRFSKKTLNKASRRKPNDLNSPGRRTQKKYYPDIHFFDDNSGSISLNESVDNIMLMAMLAKKLDVDFYYSSFATTLSQEFLVPTRGKNPQQIFEFVKTIPKVGGCTNLHYVWDYINSSAVYQERLNIINTDFEYIVGANQTVHHPKNLFYIPTRPDESSYYTWDYVRRSAANFGNSLLGFEPTIFSRMLGMTG